MSIFEHNISQSDIDQANALEWILSHYEVYGDVIFKDHVINVKGSILNREDLRRGQFDKICPDGFRFGVIEGDFYVEGYIGTDTSSIPTGAVTYSILYSNINSCRDIPGCFTISIAGCRNITSLEGISCRHLTCFRTGIKNFIGLPDHVTRINASECANLVSLKGLPEKMESLVLDGCNNLMSLEDAPKIADRLSIMNCRFIRSLRDCYSKVSYLNCEGCSGLPDLLSPIEYESISCAYCVGLRTLEHVRPDTTIILDKKLFERLGHTLHRTVKICIV